MDYDCVVAGDHYRKVGDPGRVFLYEQWKQKMSDIADTKQLFDIQRCNAISKDKLNTSLLKLTSTKQIKSGTFNLCPVCTDIDTYNRVIATNNLFPEVPGTFGYNINTSSSDNKSGSTGSGGGTQTSGGILATHQLDAPGSPGNGQSIYGWNISPRGVLITSTGPIVDNFGTPLTKSPGFIPNTTPKEPCPLCNSGIFSEQQNRRGESPSSFGGIWTPDPRKLKLVDDYARIVPELAKIEAAMGKGGTEVIEIEKNKIETVGLVMNNWGAIRVDMFGKLDAAQVQVFETHSQMVQAPSPLIEIVQVDDLPGGTYTLNVANRYSLLVGAGGMNMKSYGVVNISGAITNITGEQVNIGSALEVTIDGGKRLALVADILTLTQRDHDQVLIDSDLGVNGKTIIKGALYVEGPVYYHEAHTVAQLQGTNPHQSSGGLAKAHPDPGIVPSGTAIPVDTAHIYDVSGTTDLQASGVVPGGGKLPIYMGYADTARAVSVMPTNTLMGTTPIGTQFTATLTSVNPYLNGPVTITLTSAIPTAACPNTTAANVAAALGASVSSGVLPLQSTVTPTIGDTTPLVTAVGELANKGAIFPGAGPGTAQLNLPVRGLPPLALKKLLAEVEVGQTAVHVPIVTIGDGGHYDAVSMAPTTQSFFGPNHSLEVTNKDVRATFIRSAGLPTAPAAFDNKSNTTDLGSS